MKKNFFVITKKIFSTLLKKIFFHLKMKEYPILIHSGYLTSEEIISRYKSRKEVIDHVYTHNLQVMKNRGRIFRIFLIIVVAFNFLPYLILIWRHYANN